MRVVDDRYQIIEVIASGGMATVYRAVDLRLDRPVALKRPHPGPPDNDLEVRMEREARAAAGLNHPNVVTVYDYGRDETGPFLVMELVEGATLQDHAGVSTSEAFQIGAQIADGLAAIHAVGVVHRDVKPSNVIMSERGPMLTDFGIAHLSSTDDRITDPGTVLATPSYAAPEVLSGHPPTPASDVYSLALVVEQLATGANGDVDPAVESVLQSSKSDYPDDRPDAATLAAVLRDGVPTMAMAATPRSSGSGETLTPTLVFEVDTRPPDPRRSETRTQDTRSTWPIALLIALLALGSILALLAFADDEPGENVALGTDSTVVSSTATLATTTTTSPPATTTPVEEGPSITDAMAALEAILLEPPRSDYKDAEVEKIMRRIEDKVAAARKGDIEGAEKNLNALAKDFARKLEAEERDEAIALLGVIAESVGVEISEDVDDDDD